MPLVHIANAQHAGAGVDPNPAIGPASGKIQFDIGIQFALPAEIFGQIVGQGLQ